MCVLEPVFSPYLLSAKAAMSLKCCLQHQPWSESYSLCLEETDENTDICGVVNEQIQLIDRSVHSRNVFNF